MPHPIRIHKNIPLIRHARRTSAYTRRVVTTIVERMEVGDMIETKFDCSNVRQHLYDKGIKIVVEWNPDTNKYNVWKQ